MADRESLTLYTAIENFLEDEEVLYFEENTYLLIISCLFTRNHIPLIANYAEVVVPQFTGEMFRYHFRISLQMFEEILNIISPSLLSVHGGGTEKTDTRKQLLIFMCYISNQESMREISFHFDISISTAHAIIKGVNQAINDKLANVSESPFPLSYPYLC